MGQAFNGALSLREAASRAKSAQVKAMLEAKAEQITRNGVPASSLPPAEGYNYVRQAQRPPVWLPDGWPQKGSVAKNWLKEAARFAACAALTAVLIALCIGLAGGA